MALRVDPASPGEPMFRYAAAFVLAAVPAAARASCDSDAAAASAEAQALGRPGPAFDAARSSCGELAAARVLDALIRNGACDVAAQMGRQYAGHRGVDPLVIEADACLSEQIGSALEDLDNVSRGDAPAQRRSNDPPPPAGKPAENKAGRGYGGGGAFGGEDGSLGGVSGQAGTGSGRTASTPSPDAHGPALPEEPRRSPRASTGMGAYVDDGAVASRVGGARTKPMFEEGEKVAWSGLAVSVWFDFDSAGLRPEALSALSRAASSMRNLPEGTILEVVGHTDALGSWGYNIDLGFRRADAVRQALILAGIDASRATVRSYGEDQPVADNWSDWGRAQNRRVELRFVRRSAGLQVTR
jgi:outer membrane protein OmpA-like peptidoglycan-associated protein